MPTLSDPTIPNFSNPREKNLLQTWWEKEKMLVTSIFSFCHHVFYLPKTSFNFWVMFNLWSANSFNLDMSKILLFGEKLCQDVTQRKNVTLVPIQDIWRWLYKWELKFVFGRVENIVRKGEDAGYKHLLMFWTWTSLRFCFMVKLYEDKYQTKKKKSYTCRNSRHLQTTKQVRLETWNLFLQGLKNNVRKGEDAGN